MFAARTATASAARPASDRAPDAPAPAVARPASVAWDFGRLPIVPVARAGAPAPLHIGPPGDRLEREAEQAAERVMAAPDGPAVPSLGRTGASTDAAGAPAPASVQAVLETPGAPLDAADRAFLEPRFGRDFGHVRIHADMGAARSAAEIGAAAYTAGSHIAVGAGRTPLGRHLLAHELAHVVQQQGGSPRVQRQGEGAAAQPGGPLPLDYAGIAKAIHDAIAGLGTDEPAVYRALQALQRDPASIARLQAIYQQTYKARLEEDIRGDFSGSELEYALQLINRGQGGTKQEIKPAPAAQGDLQEVARRIRTAVEGLGTDDEAIFAALEPLHRDPALTNRLQTLYYQLYHEDLRDRLMSEMSGQRLQYALDLLESPYQRYIEEGVQKLSAGRVKSAIGFGFAWNGNFFDARYWGVLRISEQPGFELIQIRGKPHEALDALFNEQDRWHVDCAQFVQIVELYAQRHVLGAEAFDKAIGPQLELKTRQSTGVATKALFTRDAAGQRMKAANGQDDPRSVQAILDDAPIGSRVRFTNQVLIDHYPSIEENQIYGNNLPWLGFQHENSIKLGPDKFSGHGIGQSFLHIVTGAKTTYTAAEITDEIVDFTVSHGKDSMHPGVEYDPAHVRQGVFISQIEYFQTP